MAGANRLFEELDALKGELGRLVETNAAEAVSASREKLDEAAKVMRGLLEEIEQAVVREEQHLEDLVSSRPVISVAAAFLAGLALGYAVRRRP
jgi:ElaB/YqjD/DUF883 family membrane-anchored ribosome-binding protein